MSSNQFTMVSEWMINENINEFVKTHRDTNRFEFVGSCFYRRPRLPLTESLLTTQGPHPGIEIYAQPGDDTRGFEEGMILNTTYYLAS